MNRPQRFPSLSYTGNELLNPDSKCAVCGKSKPCEDQSKTQSETGRCKYILPYVPYSSANLFP